MSSNLITLNMTNNCTHSFSSTYQSSPGPALIFRGIQECLNYSPDVPPIVLLPKYLVIHQSSFQPLLSSFLVKTCSTSSIEVII